MITSPTFLRLIPSHAKIERRIRLKFPPSMFTWSSPNNHFLSQWFVQFNRWDCFSNNLMTSQCHVWLPQLGPSSSQPSYSLDLVFPMVFPQTCLKKGGKPYAGQSSTMGCRWAFTNCSIVPNLLFKFLFEAAKSPSFCHLYLCKNVVFGTIGPFHVIVSTENFLLTLYQQEISSFIL